MSQISNTTLAIAGQSLAVCGLAGVATYCLTKLIMKKWYSAKPNSANKMEDKTIEKISKTLSAVVSVVACLVTYTWLMQKQGKPDFNLVNLPLDQWHKVPAELYLQEGE